MVVIWALGNVCFGISIRTTSAQGARSSGASDTFSPFLEISIEINCVQFHGNSSTLTKKVCLPMRRLAKFEL